MSVSERPFGGSDVEAGAHMPQILIDEPVDGIIESMAWVEVNSEMTPERAVALIERDWPLEDREEEERYVCDGQTEWHKPQDPTNVNPDEDYWTEAVAGEEHAMLFFVVKVVCAA